MPAGSAGPHDQRVVKVAKGKYEYWLTEDGQLLLENWARKGLTQEQIAKNIGISRSTLKEWIKRYPAISATLNARARDLADIEVENALRKRAIGYTYTEVTRERVVDEETGESMMVVTKEVTKEVIPDVTAQIYWLKNRRPQDWRDKREAAIDVHEIPDDGFIDALKHAGSEVSDDAGDIPDGLTDEPV